MPVCRVDESQLTGEADDVLKAAGEDPLLLSGSKVLEGNGRALVIAVGPHSQAGIIANLARGSQDGPGLRQAKNSYPEEGLDICHVCVCACSCTYSVWH